MKYRSWIFILFLTLCTYWPNLYLMAAVTSMGEINARGDDLGVVPASSNVELVITINIDRSQAEPGEEIKTIEVTIPPGFVTGANDVISVNREQTELDVRPEMIGRILRIVLVNEVGDFTTSLYEIVLRSKTPSIVVKEASFKVILRNLKDLAIGEYIKPGNADGRPNNNDFILEVIPNVPPDPVRRFRAETDTKGENDVHLSWEPSSDTDVSGYFIYRDNNDQPLITLRAREAKQAVDVNVPSGDHQYAIRAYKSQLLKSESSQIISVNVRSDTAAPVSVSTLTVQTFGETVKLIWTASQSRDVEKYQILRDETVVPDGEIPAEAEKREYEFDYQYRLPKGTTVYAVVAIDEVGNESERTTQKIRIFEKPYPNPFTPLSDNPDFNKVIFPKRAIKDAEGEFLVLIFNLNGLLVKSLTADALMTKLEWDGKDESDVLVESGIYVYQIQVGSDAVTGTIILAK